ncbi:MAG: hypothetical protein AAB654_20490 [Acidobacteriota bacterium]
MKVFNDNAGRSWTISVDVNALRQVRAHLGLNLVGKDFVPALNRLQDDPMLLCDVLYVICKPQAEKQNISDEDFGRAMAGDAVEHATTAFLEELANFTPNPRDRARVNRMLSAMWNMFDKARDVAEVKMEEAIEKAAKLPLDEILAQTAVPTSGPPSTASPGSSASTPALSP